MKFDGIPATRIRQNLTTQWSSVLFPTGTYQIRDLDRLTWYISYVYPIRESKVWRQRQQQIQNCGLISLDANIDEKKEDYCEILQCLRQAVNKIEILTNLDGYFDAISGVRESVCLQIRILIRIFLRRGVPQNMDVWHLHNQRCSFGHRFRVMKDIWMILSRIWKANVHDCFLEVLCLTDQNQRFHVSCSEKQSFVES